ncbi:2-dehydropantoate 2-reductase [Cordyceps fumosorosea ARSEF 2679]|uniref:2-dehydropantoate 2-reductase n=1 Tax=Cordyceps fumosorosea (strain ARSEF 2679) TaxID=1081104 RepID=A0A168B8C4_CORFA|nr:2-dehydropantoate 2-reductase [Cordyceps fumosorosea ARSEF 2679]OAA69761.1 2-dehydropantoate 2-reductase [Cordyceps fumosorosea ARSEF 2679]
MGSQAAAPPPWLSSLLAANNPAPKLYAWTPATLGLSPSTTSSSTRRPAGPDDASRRLYILGLGNLGRLYALYIRSRADPPPITLVVHRKELLTQWHASDGIEITTHEGQVHTSKDFDVEWWTEEAPSETAAAAAAAAPIREAADGGKIHNLLVTTKAQAALPEVDRMRRYLGAQTAVAFAQNGVSRLWPPHGAAYMAVRFPAGDAFHPLLCVTNHGLYATGAPFSSVFAAPADAYLGPVALPDAPPPPPSAAYLTAQITDTPVLAAAAFSSLDVWALQLEKLVVNTCINPLTAVLRCKTGVLFADPGGVPARVMDRMLAATSRVLQGLVADASSAPILATDTRGRVPKALRAELAARFAQPRLREMLHRAGRRVGANKSSMLQDVEAGKPTTEVRDFNGWIVDAAAHLGDGVDVEVHRQVIDLVERRMVMTEEQLAAHLLPL